MSDSITIEHLTVGRLGCTCTIVADLVAKEAIVVDGGDEVDRIVDRLDALGVRATTLVHTHAHFDHIGCLAELKERTGGVGLLHAGDLPLFDALAVQAQFFGIPAPRVVALDGHLEDGDVIRAGSVRLDVLHTPGHTPGSVSFALERDEQTMLLTGDTLFRGAIGRWDIGGTSMEDIVTSIRTKLLDFADDTVVIPGHGPTTTIGIEKRQNPYLARPLLES